MRKRALQLLLTLTIGFVASSHAVLGSSDLIEVVSHEIASPKGEGYPTLQLVVRSKSKKPLKVSLYLQVYDSKGTALFSRSGDLGNIQPGEVRTIDFPVLAPAGQVSSYWLQVYGKEPSE